jgi:hypothetical protein
VGHFHGDQSEGDLGESSFRAQFDDDVRVEAKFSEAAYAYLIAFNPDGQEQLCFPHDRASAPTRAPAIAYPEDPKLYFALTDGVGLQAFVLVVSRRPLPPYATWRGETGAAPWQKGIPAACIYCYDGTDYQPLVRRVRGGERERGGPPKPLIELGTFFKKCPQVDALEVFAFPVSPKNP